MLVLLAAAVLTTATGDWTDATVILLVIVVNTSAGVIQEVKADQAISALTQLTAPDARVIRDGAQQQIPAAGVVTGDLLVLAEGDIVPADAQVIEAAALLVDESSLTVARGPEVTPLRRENGRLTRRFRGAGCCCVVDRAVGGCRGRGAGKLWSRSFADVVFSLAGLTPSDSLTLGAILQGR